jgi:hypothetical protein
MPYNLRSNTPTERRTTSNSSTHRSTPLWSVRGESGPSQRRPLPRTPQQNQPRSAPPPYRRTTHLPHQEPRRSPLYHPRTPSPLPGPTPPPQLSPIQEALEMLAVDMRFQPEVMSLETPMHCDPNPLTIPGRSSAGPNLLQVTVLINSRGYVQQMGTAYVHSSSRLHCMGGRLVVIPESAL